MLRSARVGRRDAWRRPPSRQAASPTTIVYLGKDYHEPPPLSLVDKDVTDNGMQGARIALEENNRTGRLIGQDYELLEAMVPNDGDVAAKAKELLAAGHQLIVADLEAADLLAVADLPEAKSAVILDIRTNDDVLRQEQCRANVFHIRPNWAMRADALAQYLIWKKWRRWFLIVGKSPADQGYAAAVRRAAARFGGKIVGEAPIRFEAGSRRTDTGHQQIQTQMPMLTQGVPEHDIVIVADEADVFGDYLLFRTAEPRPVAGTQGLVAVAWHRSFEEYAGTQMQNRFEKKTGRIMTERDYTAWLAVRIVGEAVDAHRPERRRRRARLHPVRQVRGRRLQGPGHELPPLGPAAAPADPPRGPARARLDLAAGRLPASEVSHRHARLRRAGEQVQAPGNIIRHGERKCARPTSC